MDNIDGKPDGPKQIGKVSSPLARRWTERELEELFQGKVHSVMLLIRQNAEEINDAAEKRKLDMASFDAFAGGTVTDFAGQLAALAGPVAASTERVKNLATALAEALKRIEKLEKRPVNRKAKPKVDADKSKSK